MPNKDISSGTEHTLYYLYVTNSRNMKTYQVTKRYSEFHVLYASIYTQMMQDFTKGMQNLFPDDRLSVWFFG